MSARHTGLTNIVTEIKHSSWWAFSFSINLWSWLGNHPLLGPGSILSGEGNGTPLQYSCPENPMDGEAWWAAVYGAAQSQTWLKRLGSSSSILSSILGAIKKKIK